MTSFITGITEPIEFMFLFVAPILYVIHAVLDGLSFLIAALLNISIGNTFSGGLIGFLLFGVFQGNDRTNWLLVIPVGVVGFFLYYFTFKFFIKKFKFGTPGHLEDTLGNDDEASSADSEAELVPARSGRPLAAVGATPDPPRGDGGHQRSEAGGRVRGGSGRSAPGMHPGGPGSGQLVHGVRCQVHGPQFAFIIHQKMFQGVKE